MVGVPRMPPTTTAGWDSGTTDCTVAEVMSLTIPPGCRPTGALFSDPQLVAATWLPPGKGSAGAPSARSLGGVRELVGGGAWVWAVRSERSPPAGIRIVSDPRKFMAIESGADRTSEADNAVTFARCLRRAPCWFRSSLPRSCADRRASE